MNADGRRYKSKSKIRFSSAFICVHLWLISFVFAFPAYAAETITVAVASSLYVEMQKQAKAFEKEHDVNIRLIPGSTGRLYNQIMQGAPFDVFIAADSERPARLAEQGKVLAQYNVGQGYLGLMRGHEPMTDLKQLTAPSIRHIAIANPDVAPFGLVTKKLLQQRGLWQTLKPKLVYAQNALQAKMLVEKGLVDAGFVPLPSHDQAMARIQYQGVLLTDGMQARQLLHFIGRVEAARTATNQGSGSVAQGECCLQQRERPGVLAAQIVSDLGTAEAVLPKVQIVSNKVAPPSALSQ